MSILPRPVSPKSAFADLRDLLSGPLPHKWPLAVLSIGLTTLIIWAFYLDAKVPMPPPQVNYVESWMADRKDSVILEKQKADLALYEAALQRKQREFQGVADRVGLEWRTEEAKNRTRREAIIAAINKQLDARIVAAKKREAAEAVAKGAS